MSFRNNFLPSSGPGIVSGDGRSRGGRSSRIRFTIKKKRGRAKDRSTAVKHILFFVSFFLGL